VGFVSKIGGDPFGKVALERLSAIGVDAEHVKRDPASTTGLTVVMPHEKNRHMLTYPGTMFEMQYSDIEMDYVLGAKHFHLSSFFLHRALLPHILTMFRRAKEAGLSTSLDTNDDPDDRWAREPGETNLHALLKYVDVFLPNEREAKKIAGTGDLDEALKVLAGLSKVVAVKCGSKASICRARDEEWRVLPPRVSFLDDVGAGDTFAAGFIHAYLRGKNLEHCLAFANIAAAYSVTQAGGTEAFHHREGLRNFIREQWSFMGRDISLLED
jgi:sugar/nucleoside kinase (ribokinase family)